MAAQTTERKGTLNRISHTFSGLRRTDSKIKHALDRPLVRATAVGLALLVPSGVLAACSGSSGNEGSTKTSASPTTGESIPAHIGGTPSETPSAAPSVSLDTLVNHPDRFYRPNTVVEVLVPADQATTAGAENPITFYFKQASGHTGNVTGELNTVFSIDKSHPKGNLPIIISEVTRNGQASENGVLAALGIERDIKQSKSFIVFGEVVKVTKTNPANIKGFLRKGGDSEGYVLDVIAAQV